MRLRVGAGVIRGVLLAAVGAAPTVACGGSETGAGPAANGGSSSGGQAGSGGREPGPSGGTSPGGAGGLVTGGTAPSGGAGGTAPTGGAGGALPTGGAGGHTAEYACKNPKPVARVTDGEPSGLVQCEDGVIQRAPGFTCTNRIVPTEGPYIPEGLPEVTCRTHADCTERDYGYCIVNSSGFEQPTRSLCNYGCLTDADCEGGAACVCGNGLVGTCYAGCKSSDDCSGAQPCAFVTYTSGCGNVDKLQCGLDCRKDADCEQGACVNGGCQYPVPCGRPFLVEGAARRAPPAIRGDWADSMTPSTEHLGADVRAALAAHWTDIGLMEHASVAAFARFALQLLSLGAPSSLIESATAALADETAHARLCFGIASAYAGRDVGPGPLPMDRALAAGTFTDIVHTAFLEACIGETTAALEAAECAAHAEDPVIAAALRRIAADETRHAELGWRFVTWALETSDAGTRRRLLGEFCAIPGAAAGAEPSDDALLEHGVASGALRAAVRDAALRDVVRPCLAALITRFDPQSPRGAPLRPAA